MQLISVITNFLKQTFNVCLLLLIPWLLESIQSTTTLCKKQSLLSSFIIQNQQKQYTNIIVNNSEILKVITI